MERKKKQNSFSLASPPFVNTHIHGAEQTGALDELILAAALHLHQRTFWKHDGDPPMLKKKKKF